MVGLVEQRMNARDQSTSLSLVRISYKGSYDKQMVSTPMHACRPGGIAIPSSHMPLLITCSIKVYMYYKQKVLFCTKLFTYCI